jgi:hypothetical protein
MITFHRGDRVKLTEPGIKIQGHGYRRFGHDDSEAERMVKWRDRRGVVVATPMPGGACVSVKWDDRKSFDAYPQGMIELAHNKSAVRIKGAG